ncbi:staphylocoagulase repeat protein [uncultured Mediterranean phage uvDeep-CGR2-AD3-C191]|nr:staphylocoagulase repeat protein [uncultured Mediterranean phage uvDeep-CGR2-AD3-C191]
MATVYADKYTDHFQTSPPSKAHASLWGGRLKVQYGLYEASSVGAGSIIYFFKVPANATVWDINLHFDALGSSSTLAVGDSGDIDRYIDATDSSSAGAVNMGEGANIDGFGYLNSSETDIYITTAGATISGTIKMSVVYSVD